MRILLTVTTITNGRPSECKLFMQLGWIYTRIGCRADRIFNSLERSGTTVTATYFSRHDDTTVSIDEYQMPDVRSAQRLHDRLLPA